MLLRSPTTSATTTALSLQRRLCCILHDKLASSLGCHSTCRARNWDANSCLCDAHARIANQLEMVVHDHFAYGREPSASSKYMQHMSQKWQNQSDCSPAFHSHTPSSTLDAVKGVLEAFLASRFLG